MRKGFVLALVFVMLSLLAACQVNVNGGDLPPGLEIRNATYGTNFEAELDGELQDVICNDKVTDFTYSFIFDGDLDTWESYLKGVETGRVAGRISLDLDSEFVKYDRATGRVTVNYKLNPGAAPQAIVISPKVIGESQLFLQFGTYNYELLSNPVPILQSCN